MLGCVCIAYSYFEKDYLVPGRSTITFSDGWVQPKRRG
jgi:hypothetical protein